MAEVFVNDSAVGVCFSGLEELETGGAKEAGPID